MTNTLSISKNTVLTVSKKVTLQALNIEGDILFTRDFEQQICALAADLTNGYIAVGVKKQGEGKKPNLYIFHVDQKENTLSDVLSFELPHEAIQLAFATYNDGHVILALNSGEIDAINIETKKSTTLLGSIATGTSFALSPSSNLIVSADRDARIRISNYPRTFDIRAFAFHHEEFVSSVTFVDDEFIVSGDGDGQIIKWNTNGESQIIKQISEKNTIIRKIVTSGSIVYVIIENDNHIYLLDSESLDITEKIPLSSAPLTIVNATEGNVLALTASGLYLLHDKKLKEILKNEIEEAELKQYSLESQRVKFKKIIHKAEKGTEDYEMWRNPEKTPSRDQE